MPCKYFHLEFSKRVILRKVKSFEVRQLLAGILLRGMNAVKKF